METKPAVYVHRQPPRKAKSNALFGRPVYIIKYSINDNFIYLIFFQKEDRFNWPVELTDDSIQEIVPSNALLRDDHINAGISLFHNQFPHIQGMFAVDLGGTADMFPKAEGDQWIQIVNDPHAQHWLVAAYGFNGLGLIVYDSMRFHKDGRAHFLACLASLVRTEEEELAYHIASCQKQDNNYDCGIFAIAFAVSLANGKNPSQITYDPVQLRPHYIDCLNNNELTEFPTKSNMSRRSLGATEKIAIYCTCRRTDYWDMIECGNCQKRYHKMCVKNLPKRATTKWNCVQCKKK